MIAQIISQKTIQSENRKRMLRLLTSNRELTITEISRKLDISIPTVSKNINQLKGEGLVEEAGVSSSSGGRRPMLVKFVPDAYYSFGIEFAAERYVRIILTDLDSKIIVDSVLQDPDFNNIDSLMHEIHRRIGSVLLDSKIPAQKILGIGFSLPGTTDGETGLLKIAPNLMKRSIVKLRNVDFQKYESLFQLPLFIENDANAAAMAELTLGIAKVMQNLVFLSIMSYGIGGAIVAGGHIYQGKNNRAGEFSHMKISSHGRKCICGRRDCWESYASLNVLMTMYQEQTGNAISSVNDFFALLNKYDRAAVEVLDKYLDHLAIGIQNIILIQDPHYVIIGGILSLFEEFFLEPLQEKVFVNNIFYDRADLQIMCSALKEDASIIGASLLPLERIFSLHGILSKAA
ncbi:MAG: ROK family transcriptional regulator [Deltaproteobacteria bacterium]|nr:ROK family transcriptional regulator [Deltaproteobacteria bacterium]MBT8374721.1 ROK family transcriptional regulator [Deltaproteobacteria bacterium]